jgi:hypothetical protein
MGENVFRIGASEAPLYPDDKLGNNLIVFSWMPEKSNSILHKMRGYEVQTRVTLLPQEIQIQEVTRSRLERAWQGFYSKLSTLWDGKPDFRVSVFADAVIPTELSQTQADHLKTILKNENLTIDSLNEFALMRIFGRVRDLVKSVGGKLKLNDQEYEKFVSRSFKLLKMGFPQTLIAGDKQWEASKKAILDFSDDYFKGDSDTFLYQHADSIVDRINSTLADEKFLKDPKAYMAAWGERRGSTEEYRIPEDPARNFMNKLFA